MTTLTIPTFTSGAPLSGTDETQIATLLNFLINPPRFVGRATAAQSIPNTTWTAITLDTEDIDSYNGHSTSVNTSRYTPTQPGWYWFAASCILETNATGSRALSIVKNAASTDRYGKTQPVTSSGTVRTGMSIAVPIYANGTTDYFEMMVYQNTGGALNTNKDEDGVPGSNPRFSATFLGSSAT